MQGKRELYEMGNSGASKADTQNLQNTVTITELADLLKAEIQLRKKFFNGLISGNHSWAVLLELLMLKNEEQDRSVTAISTLGDIQATTGLRWIGVLKDEGLVAVADDVNDDRQQSLALTDQGRKDMKSYLEEVAELKQLRLVG